MLSDDITQTARSGFSKFKSLLGGIVRGAVIGALGAVAVLMCIGLASGIGAAFAATTALGALGALGGGVLAGGSMVAAGGSAILTTAEVVAGVLGVATLIPGADRGFGLKGLFKRRPDPTRMPDFDSQGRTVDPVQVTVPQRPVIVHQAAPQVVVHENPHPVYVQGNSQPVLLQNSQQPLLLNAAQTGAVKECPTHVIINSNTPQVFLKETSTVMDNSPTLLAQETTANVITAQDNTSNTMKDNTANVLLAKDNIANVVNAQETLKDNSTNVLVAKDNTANVVTAKDNTTLLPQENYLYQPGLGMKLMEKGDAAPATNVQRA